MLYFVSAELALGYWIFAFLSALGALQWVAVRYRLGGLAFVPPGGGREYSANRAWGYALAALLIVAGAAGFFTSQWQAIFAPGPAGAELGVLFSSSAACALLLTLILAPSLERWRRAARFASRNAGDYPLRPDRTYGVPTDGQPVTIGHATGKLYTPPGPTTLAPAVCLLPGCPVGASWALPSAAGRTTGVEPRRAAEAASMSILARRLAAEGVVALVVNPDEQSYVYPAILATLPAAVAFLRDRPDVDPNRLGAVGEDLGADLVIRAAITCKEVKAVAALAPILENVPAGLDLLHEMSYCRAMRWARDRKRATLRKELNAREYGSKIPPRPFLLVYGEEDKLAGEVSLVAWNSDFAAKEPGTSQLRVIPGLGHLNLAAHPMVMQIVSQWLKECL